MSSILACCVRPLRLFLSTQIWLSRYFDRLLPKYFLLDGNADFVGNFVSPYIRPGTSVIDVGGGKQPLISLARKRELGVSVVGFDVNAEELARAPRGAYDEVVCADICSYHGDHSAELVICQAVLEHVPDVSAALASLSAMVYPGGAAVVFVPSRNAWFARLNRVLPQAFKRWLLFTVFPKAEREQGFPAYYDHCTPHELATIAAKHGLRVERLTLYFTSSYFSCFFPLHLLWRLYLLVLHAISPARAAETFSLVLRKDPLDRCP